MEVRIKKMPLLKRSLVLVGAVASLSFYLGQKSAGDRAPEKTPVSLPQGVFSSRVVKVYDGDTVSTQDGRKIRLLGIDTPEKGFRDEFGVYREKPAPFALQATERLKKLAQDETCSFSFDKQPTDRYGRTLAFMTCRGVDVNRTMLEEGFASVMIYPPNGSRKEEFLAVQRTAQSKGVGLWADGIVPADAAVRHINELRVVRGIVHSVSPQKSMIYLNFGADYLTDFTVGIRRRDWKLFSSVGVSDPMYYAGKEISVTGRVRERNGPYIDVTIPEQIAVEHDGSGH